MPNIIKDGFSAGLASLASGLILWLIQTNVSTATINLWLLIFIALTIGICVYLAIFVFRCESLGISKILNSSVKGDGSTMSYMKSANSSICFVGIAASKWIEKGDELEKAIRTICSLNTGYIKFLLLNPNSLAAKKLSLAGSQNADQVGEKINRSLSSIKKLIDRLSNDYPQALNKFEIKLYDQMPVFRLAIIDNRRAYFCFYQLGCDGSKLKQFVIKPKQRDNPNTQNIFNSMSEYFDSLWNAPATILYPLYQTAESESGQNVN